MSLRADGEPPSIPRPAAWLGAAGLIPFLGLAAMAQLAEPVAGAQAARALGFYGALILSFMGGAQWGLAVSRGERGLRPYAASVVPSLLAWSLLALPSAAGLLGLAAGLVGLMAYDLWTVRRGEAPAWYGRLRWRLTAVAACSLVLATL